MAIGKKTRFEIFKRDSFTCSYCGQTPPAVVLEVDHIKPKSKKGTDDINNLTTSCFDCNRGKRNIELTQITPKLSENLEILREKEAQLKEYYKHLNKIEKRILDDVFEITTHFEQFYNGEVTFQERFQNGTIRQFLKTLNKYEIKEALDISYSKMPDREDNEKMTRYFCGICWNWIKNPETKQGFKYGD